MFEETLGNLALELGVVDYFLGDLSTTSTMPSTTTTIG